MSAKARRGSAGGEDSVTTGIGADRMVRRLDAAADAPDLRDRYYEPGMTALQPSILPPPNPRILDQGSETRCTGYALAGAINLLKQQHLDADAEETKAPGPLSASLQSLTRFFEAGGASPRMLFELARMHDEWEGSNYGGSSIRGALKGFYHNGVASLDPEADAAPDDQWTLSVERAKAARAIGLGAYYRLRPSIVDYHAALNQTGVVLASARIHGGWQNPRRGVIGPSRRALGVHAFIIVGYDENGFLVQNSWGSSWGKFLGRPGVAHWPYEDWADSILDGWVMRLAVSTPGAFDLTHSLMRREGDLPGSGGSAWNPRRQDVIGHIIHLDGGALVETGRLATPLESLQETGARLKDAVGKADRKYDHILFFAHGSLAGSEVGARRVAAMRDVFLRNRIYPIHIMWETGISDTIQDVLAGISEKARQRVGTDALALDWTIESTARSPGLKLWRAIKHDAVEAFATTAQPGANGYDGVRAILAANAGSPAHPYKIHMVSHSAGAYLLGECLGRWAADAPGRKLIENCILLAPACTITYYLRRFSGLLKNKAIGRISQYVLSVEREEADVAGHYNKSMLSLISNAFEEARGEHLLGLARHFDEANLPARHTLYMAGRGKDKARTDADTHNGFASDRTTLNHILKTVLGDKYKSRSGFRESDLAGL